MLSALGVVRRWLLTWPRYYFLRTQDISPDMLITVRTRQTAHYQNSYENSYWELLAKTGLNATRSTLPEPSTGLTA